MKKVNFDFSAFSSKFSCSAVPSGVAVYSERPNANLSFPLLL